MPEPMTVEVVYALPDRQDIRALEVPAGSSLEQAIQASGILQRHPEIDLSQNKVGVFGKLGKLDATLHAHDRVEIYRPLRADPKDVRRQRAAQGKSMKKGGESGGRVKE